MNVQSSPTPKTGAVDQVRLPDGPTTLRSRFMVVDDFLDETEAAAMRGHIDTHFSDPQNHSAEIHQIWNYWYIPRLYTYLRTRPEKVMPDAVVHHFVDELRSWAKERLGLGYVSWPFLSLYVNGCVQELHNDSLGGRFGYVYSLTRNDRSSRGGQTIVLQEGDLFRSKLTTAEAGSGLYDLVPPDFNRLVVFDDRMPHGVQRVEGSMDPYDGRLVLHGHLSEDGPIADGPLTRQALQKAVLPAITATLKAAGAGAQLHHGPLVVRLAIGADGIVQDHRVLVDRVARPDGQSPAELVGALIEAMAGSRFPEQPKPTVATIPLMLGGVLPWMKQQMPAQQ